MAEKKKAVEKSVKRDKRLDNLKPFKPGQSGNPKGPPKGYKHFSVQAKEDLAGLVKIKDSKERVTRFEAIVRSVVNKAMRGDLKAVEMLLDRIEGKVTQPIDQKTELVVQWKYPEEEEEEGK